MKTIDEIEFNRADNGAGYVTGYEMGLASYTHKLSTTKDLIEWIKDVNASQATVKVAQTDKKNIPRVPDIYQQDEMWIPFALKHDKMPRRAQIKPKYLIIHWTAGDPGQKGLSGIEEGAARGFTYLFLERGGILWQGAPTDAGGYHIGSAKIDSFQCLGVEVACAGRLQKIGDLFVPWYAKDKDGKINEERCISKNEVIYDEDGPEDDESFAGYYQLFTVPQLDTLERLSLYFCQELGGSPDRILGHDFVATPYGRKVDPGYSMGMSMKVWREHINELLVKGVSWKRDLS